MNVLMILLLVLIISCAVCVAFTKNLLVAAVVFMTQSLLLSLDLKGIAGSSGSACTSGSLDPSHVLLAIGLPHEIAHGSLRLSLSEENTEEEVDFTIASLQEIVARLRAMSPLWPENRKNDR